MNEDIKLRREEENRREEAGGQNRHKNRKATGERHGRLQLNGRP